MMPNPYERQPRFNPNIFKYTGIGLLGVAALTGVALVIGASEATHCKGVQTVPVKEGDAVYNVVRGHVTVPDGSYVDIQSLVRDGDPSIKDHGLFWDNDNVIKVIQGPAHNPTTPTQQLLDGDSIQMPITCS